MTLSQAEIAARVAALGPWFHRMSLGGVDTRPDHPLGDYPRLKWRRFADALPADLRGRTVLDIGCNGGFYALQMKRRGADRVLAIDHDPDYLAQARFAAEVEGLDVEFAQASVYDVAALDGPFDVVLFMGVLYHLRHPLLALDLIRDYAARDLLVFQSMLRGLDEPVAPEPDYPFTEERVFEAPGWPRLAFVEGSFAQDCTNWWIPNRACAEAMLRSAGFRIEARPEDEVYVCRRVETARSWSVHPARPPR